MCRHHSVCVCIVGKMQSLYDFSHLITSWDEDTSVRLQLTVRDVTELGGALEVLFNSHLLQQLLLGVLFTEAGHEPDFVV